MIGITKLDGHILGGQYLVFISVMWDGVVYLMAHSHVINDLVGGILD